MNQESNRDDGSTYVEQDPRAIGKLVPDNPPKQTINLQVLADAGEKIGSALQPANSDHREYKIEQPISVDIIKNAELTNFEKKTVRFGYWGLVIAACSLVAATVAAWLVFQQFREMALQTNLLGTAAQQARRDSAEASVSMAKQLQTFRDQLMEQKRALEIEQRPWLKFELGGGRSKDTDPNNGKNRQLFLTPGQPIKVEVRVTNIGRTTAENIRGTLAVQFVRKGEKPTLVPKRGKNISFTEGSKPHGGSMPGTEWMEATLYPNEVSQNYFSRSRWGKDGRVEDDPITQAEKTELYRGNAYLLLIGEVWYSDVFKIHHWTKFCEISNSEVDPAIAKQCVAFGAIDANQTNKP